MKNDDTSTLAADLHIILYYCPFVSKYYIQDPGRIMRVRIYLYAHNTHIIRVVVFFLLFDVHLPLIYILYANFLLIRQIPPSKSNVVSLPRAPSRRRTEYIINGEVRAPARFVFSISCTAKLNICIY